MSNTKGNNEEPRTAPRRSPCAPTSIATSVPEVSLVWSNISWLNTKISNNGDKDSEKFRGNLAEVQERKNYSNIGFEKSRNKNSDFSVGQPPNYLTDSVKCTSYSNREISAQPSDYTANGNTSLYSLSTHAEQSHCHLYSDQRVQRKDLFESRQKKTFHAAGSKTSELDRISKQHFSDNLKSQKYSSQCNNYQSTALCGQNTSPRNSGNANNYQDVYSKGNAQNVIKRNIREEIQSRQSNNCHDSKVAVGPSNKSFSPQTFKQKRVFSGVFSECSSKETYSPQNYIAAADSERNVQTYSADTLNKKHIMHKSPSGKTVVHPSSHGTVLHPSAVDLCSISRERVREMTSLNSPQHKINADLKYHPSSQEKSVERIEKGSGNECKTDFKNTSPNTLSNAYSDRDLTNLYKLVQLNCEQLQTLQMQVNKLLLYQEKNERTYLHSDIKEHCAKNDCLQRHGNLCHSIADESTCVINDQSHCRGYNQNLLRKCDELHYPVTFQSRRPSAEEGHDVQNLVKRQMVDKSSQTMFEDEHHEIAVGTDSCPLVSVGVMTSFVDREQISDVTKTRRLYEIKEVDETKTQAPQAYSNNRSEMADLNSNDRCLPASEINPVDETICFNIDDLPSVHREYSPVPSIHIDMQDFEEDMDSVQESDCSREGSPEQNYRRESPEQKETEDFRRAGWTFYDKVVGQVNRILEPPADKEKCENPHAEYNPCCNGGHGKTQEDYRRATVDHLRRLGIDFHNSGINCAIAAETRRTSHFDQMHNPQLPSVPLKADSSASDSSIQINALALKYLKHDQLGMADDKMQDVTFYNLAMKATNFSVGTLRYLERYQLLPANIMSQGEVGEGVTKVRELHNIPKAAKMPEMCNGCKCGDNITVTHRPPLGSVGRILDITAIKNQPKLL